VNVLSFLVAFPSVVIGAFLVLFFIARWNLVPADRKRSEYLLVMTMFSVIAGSVAQGIANDLTYLRPLKYDLYIYQIDRIFGEPSFVLGQLVTKHLLLQDLVGFSYGIIPMMMLGVFAAYLFFRSEWEAWQVAWIFAVNFLAILPLYLLCPVCGPRFAFPAFPSVPADVIVRSIPISAAPNGVPSGHTSGALLIFWLLRRWMWGRVIGTLFLALTIFATLGSGQHYFFDLLCAVPYAAGVYWIARRINMRQRREVLVVS
jgi:membrane-associated phospholipid phosphatase